MEKLTSALRAVIHALVALALLAVVVHLWKNQLKGLPHLVVVYWDVR